MKIKAGWFIIVCFMGLVLFNSVSYAAPYTISKKIPVTYRGIQILVDGKAISGAEPFIMDNKGIVMVPVRTVSEAVGKSVDWDGTKNMVYIGSAPFTAPETNSANYSPPAQRIIKKVNYVTYRGIQISAGGKIIGGEEPFIHTIHGIVMVPLRVVAEATGKSVAWDAKKNTVEITSGSGSTVKPKTTTQSQNTVQPKTDNFVWLENMMVIRNVGPFFRQNGESFTIAAGSHKNGLGVRLRGGAAEMVVRTHGKYRAMEGWLGVDDETCNTSGAFFFSVFADNKEVHSHIEAEGGAERIIDRIPVEHNYDYSLVETDNIGDGEGNSEQDSIYKTTYPVNSNLYEKTPLFISGPILPASYPKYISPSSVDISGALTVTIRVTWVAGEGGDYSDLTAVLADFKFIK